MESNVYIILKSKSKQSLPEPLHMSTYNKDIIIIIIIINNKTIYFLQMH